MLLADVLAMGASPTSSGSLDMRGFDIRMLMMMCILSGCDYCPGVKLVGIKTAHDLVRRHHGKQDKVVMIDSCLVGL